MLRAMTQPSSQVVSVTCNQCGAPLQVPESTRFLTCAHCGSRLEVQRSSGAVYTQVLESIGQATQQIAADVDAIRRQNEVERLDREWMMRRNDLMVTGKGGRVSKPSAAGAAIGAIIALVFGIFWIGLAVSKGAPAFFPLFGLIFIAAALVGGIKSIIRAGQYDDEERSYRQRRDGLLRQDSDRP